MDTLKNEGYIRVIANNEQFVPYCVINLEKKQGNLLKGIDNKTVRLQPLFTYVPFYKTFYKVTKLFKIAGFFMYIFFQKLYSEYSW